MAHGRRSAKFSNICCLWIRSLPNTGSSERPHGLGHGALQLGRFQGILRPSRLLARSFSKYCAIINTYIIRKFIRHWQQAMVPWSWELHRRLLPLLKEKVAVLHGRVAVRAAQSFPEPPGVLILRFLGKARQEHVRIRA